MQLILLASSRLPDRQSSSLGETYLSNPVSAIHSSDQQRISTSFASSLLWSSETDNGRRNLMDAVLNKNIYVEPGIRLNG
jgi:hypothetical protein